VSWFQNLFEARRTIAAWRRDYNEERPHSSLNYLTPAEFATRSGGVKDAGCACLENEKAVFHFPTAAAAAG
jgi:putative transposase